MSAVNEWVAKEYFEQLGYFVRQPRKYTVPGRQKSAQEEIDLVIHNLHIREHKIPSPLIWTTRELKTVARAIVGVRGWHTERFYASTFEQTPEILRFAEPDSVEFAAKLLGATDMAKVLCLPRLPASGNLKEKALESLKARGIDGVITFETMLSELVAGTQVNRNYEKSDLLQVIRLLKNYDLIREPQMELFAKRKRRQRRSK